MIIYFKNAFSFTSWERHQERLQLDGVNSPHIHSLCEEKVVVEMSDGPVHCIAVSHFHHGRSRLTLHELHLREMTEDRVDLFSAMRCHRALKTHQSFICRQLIIVLDTMAWSKGVCRYGYTSSKYFPLPKCSQAPPISHEKLIQPRVHSGKQLNQKQLDLTCQPRG